MPSDRSLFASDGAFCAVLGHIRREKLKRKRGNEIATSSPPDSPPPEGQGWGGHVKRTYNSVV